MSVERFLILFVVYGLSVACGLAGANSLKPSSSFKKWLVVTIIGFIVLATPLTILTLLK